MVWKLQKSTSVGGGYFFQLDLTSQKFRIDLLKLNFFENVQNWLNLQVFWSPRPSISAHKDGRANMVVRAEDPHQRERCFSYLSISICLQEMIKPSLCIERLGSTDTARHCQTQTKLQLRTVDNFVYINMFYTFAFAV